MSSGGAIQTRRVGVVGLMVVTLLVLAVPARAHTDLVSSSPSDDAVVAGPVDDVTLTFTQPIELAGGGVEVLDADAQALAADVTVEAAVVTVRPRRPLDSGPYGVRWAVRSGDAHPVRGTFFFTVTVEQSALPPASERAASEPTSEGSTATTGQDSAGSDATVPAVAGAAMPGTADDATPALDAALTEDSTRAIRWLDQGLRAVFYAVALGAVGVLVFLVGVWEGSRREARRLTRLTARLGGSAAVVVVAQVVVGSRRTAGGWSEAVASIPSTVTGSYAFGMTLRLVGAALLAVGCAKLGRALRRAVAPIAGGALDVGTRPVDIVASAPLSAAQRVRAAPTAVFGAVALVASFAFVGHAATAASRAVAATAVIGHVTAAAVWGGGLLALVVTLATRHRAHTPLRAGLVAARFSVVATVGLVLAAVAGVTLASMRLDSVAALWTSSYGLVLLAKVAAVGVAAALGAYNHVVVVPMLRQDPEHAIGHRLRRLGLVEVTLLSAVVALTAVLVELGG